ncbi:30S ribosomal protein S5 [Patescibacteria group bacterium]
MRGPRNEVREFEERVVKISRVSKKTKGGNRIGFSALTVVGDRKGRVGMGLGKAPDVASAIRKGMKKARKNMVTISLKGTTIPHEVRIKKGAAKLLFKPARPGTGIIAGGPVRIVVEVAGIKDIVSKILGTTNKASNVYAAIEALKILKLEDNKNRRPNKKSQPVKK